MRKGFALGLFALMLASVAVTLAACNTTAGFGKDMQAAGQAITNSANNVKNRI